MQIIEALEKIDAIKPSNYTQDEKIAWLSQLDMMVVNHIISRYKGSEQYREFFGYDADTDVTTELLVPAPYDEVYIPWLESKIDYTNGEYSKYNNAVTHFNDLYSMFRNNYNRTHEHLAYKYKL